MLSLLLLSALAAHPGQPDTVFISYSPAPTMADAMLAYSNRYVARQPSPALMAAAQQYADYLYRTRQQSHFANGGPEQRARAAGFTGSIQGPWTQIGAGERSTFLGEVLCFGARNPSEAFDGWMHSSGHRKALTERTFTHCGFGARGDVWVGMFGRQLSPQSLTVSDQAAGPVAATVPVAFIRGGCPNGACNQVSYVQKQAPQQYQQQAPVITNGRAYRTGPLRGGCGGAGRRGLFGGGGLFGRRR